MAVVTSLDLTGNKQSFANWISNLSPCDTPFTSMIGKEAIDQIQYSWQTDTLAPADNHAYEEGSLVTAQARAVTKELTNFTSILRVVASVSKTAEVVGTHGRGSELAYQMSKAGKELMRDLEWANLSHVNGNIGTATRAGKFAGFEGLVGGINVADGDTGAVVHKDIEISSKRTSCISAEDIFDMTYNLYLAGSRADKIMFHPKHAIAFSLLLGNNPDAPSTYRMFDNLDTKLNTQVKKLRDPLGRVYTLIPNRFVPEDKIYFFNEADWTQMILRPPHRTQLAKKGSSEQHMIELEVGLRHRHPYASGVLTLKDVSINNEMPLPRNHFNTNISDAVAVSNQVNIDGAGEGGINVHFYSSDPAIVSFDNELVITGGSGRAANRLRGGTKRGVAQVWSVAKGVKSEVHTVTCSDPTISLTVDNNNPRVGETVTFTAAVIKADGSPTGKGLPIVWFSDAPAALEFAEPVTNTNDVGFAIVTAEVVADSEVVVRAYLNRLSSPAEILNYVPAPAIVEAPVVTPDTFAVGTSVDATVDVFDHNSEPLSHADVHWTVFPTGIVTLNSDITQTDDSGIATVTLTGANRGVAQISATCGTVTSTQTVFYVGTGATMDFEIGPNPAPVGESVKFTVSMIGHDGSPLADQPVTFATTPTMQPLIPGGVTDINGVYEVSISPLFAADLKVTASCVPFGVAEILDFQVINGGI